MVHPGAARVAEQSEASGHFSLNHTLVPNTAWHTVGATEHTDRGLNVPLLKSFTLWQGRQGIPHIHEYLAQK